MINVPQVITLDLIKELRRSGDSFAAEELMKAYRKDLKKVKHTELLNIRKTERRVKKHFGICCKNDCKNLVVEGYTVCSKCRIKTNEYNKIKRETYHRNRGE